MSEQSTRPAGCGACRTGPTYPESPAEASLAPGRTRALAASVVGLLAALHLAYAGRGAAPGGEDVATRPAATGASATTRSRPAAKHLDDPAGFPAVLGALKRGKHHRYSHPSLGYSVRYSSPGKVRADVYVYDGGLGELLATSPGPAVERHFQDVKEQVFRVGRSDGYGVVHVQDDQVPFGSTPGAPSAHRARFILRLEAGDAASWAYLTVYAGRFVKVRCTYLAELGPAGDKMLKDFVDALARFVLTGPQAATASTSRSRPVPSSPTRPGR